MRKMWGLVKLFSFEAPQWHRGVGMGLSILCVVFLLFLLIIISLERLILYNVYLW